MYTNIRVFPHNIFTSIIQSFIVLTTSHQAMIAHKKFHIADINNACFIVIVFDHTAGHTLFALSFAHIFIAI